MTRPEFGTLPRGRDIFDLQEVVRGLASLRLTRGKHARHKSQPRQI